MSCPFCGSDNQKTIKGVNCHVICTCGASGPRADTLENAKKLWDKRETKDAEKGDSKGTNPPGKRAKSGRKKPVRRRRKSTI